MDDHIEQPKISQGFDRGIDYIDIKKKLISKYNEIQDTIIKLDTDSKDYDSKKRIWNNKLIYCIISLIQLKNGCRIIEACKAIKLFFKDNDFKSKVVVKIAKSAAGGKKARFRKIAFPNWIEFELTDDLINYLSLIRTVNLKQRVLDFLLKEFKCNTHSLRYALINYMLYVKKIEMGLVAKFVGHVNVNQLVTYTSNKNADGIFDLD